MKILLVCVFLMAGCQDVIEINCNDTCTEEHDTGTTMYDWYDTSEDTGTALDAAPVQDDTDWDTGHEDPPAEVQLPYGTEMPWDDTCERIYNCYGDDEIQCLDEMVESPGLCGRVIDELTECMDESGCNRGVCNCYWYNYHAHCKEMERSLTE
jgi:hypothetical protein